MKWRTRRLLTYLPCSLASEVWICLLVILGFDWLTDFVLSIVMSRWLCASTITYLQDSVLPCFAGIEWVYLMNSIIETKFLVRFWRTEHSQTVSRGDECELVTHEHELKLENGIRSWNHRLSNLKFRPRLQLQSFENALFSWSNDLSEIATEFLLHFWRTEY